MCLYPKLIKNPKYKPNKKNGGQVPPLLDKRIGVIPIGCGKCMQCMKQKSRNWQYRIIEDIKVNTNAKFITLTFSNKSIKELAEELKELSGYALDNAIATLAVRRFLERWRKEYGKSVRHWLVTELGHNGTENIHLHGILWTDKIESIERIWKYGYVWDGKKVNEMKINYVSAKTASYITKYMNKIDKKHIYYNSIVLCSKGIGSNYVEKNKKKDYYKGENGSKIALNTYWKNKLFSEEERERLWIEKLDKGERWIGGKRYKADDIEGIRNALRVERRYNKELGYGDDEKNWQQQEYENKCREINIYKRINNIK